jgi:hypothetical protein
MIEEVWAEVGLMQDVLAKISTELTKAAKNAVLRLNQGPAGIQEYMFTEWAQDSINRLSQAAKLEPQETTRQVEERKD